MNGPQISRESSSQFDRSTNLFIDGDELVKYKLVWLDKLFVVDLAKNLLVFNLSSYSRVKTRIFEFKTRIKRICKNIPLIFVIAYYNNKPARFPSAPRAYILLMVLVVNQRKIGQPEKGINIARHTPSAYWFILFRLPISKFLSRFLILI